MGLVLGRSAADVERGLAPARQAFHFWLKEQLRVDRPYDQLVHDVLTPSAKVHATIPSLAVIGRSNQLKSRFVESPDDYRISNRLDHIDALTIDISRVFLGVNTSCISCHNGARQSRADQRLPRSAHARRVLPHGGVLRADAAHRQLERQSRRTSNRDLQVDDLATGYDGGNDAPFLTLAESQFPRPKRAHEPAFLLTGEKPRPGCRSTPNWRHDREPPAVRAATVNLIWRPAHDRRLRRAVRRIRPVPRLAPPIRSPTNLALLDALADDSRTSGFRLKHTITTIMKSSAYQLSARFPGEWNDRYLDYYPRHYVRVMTGPEVVDAVSRVTERADAVHSGWRAGRARGSV